MQQRYALKPRFLDDLMRSTGRGMTLTYAFGAMTVIFLSNLCCCNYGILLKSYPS